MFITVEIPHEKSSFIIQIIELSVHALKIIKKKKDYYIKSKMRSDEYVKYLLLICCDRVKKRVVAIKATKAKQIARKKWRI